MSNILSKIIHYPFPENQFFKEKTVKKQIYLHHTVSPANNAKGVCAYFASSPEKIATHIVINDDGTPYQLYSTDYWAYHLGLKDNVFKTFGVPYQVLDKISIAIEICAAGPLIQKNGKWYSSFNTVIPDEKVQIYPNGFRGAKGFEKYTAAQIQTVKELLLYWKTKWNIPLTYNEKIFDLYKPALQGVPGVYTHCSVRTDKSDIHPQPEMIEMLKSLSD